MVTPQCAGCGRQAEPGHDRAGFPVATPDGWYWLTKLRGSGRWYFCSLACVACWSARVVSEIERLAA